MVFAAIARAFYGQQAKAVAPGLPLGWLMLAAVAFVGGQAVQDLFNRDSWLRSLWRLWTRSYDVVLAGPFQGNNPPRIDWVIKVTMRRDIWGGSLRLRAHSCTGLKRPATLRLLQQEVRDFAKGETFAVAVASLPIPGVGGWTIAVDNAWQAFDPTREKRWVVGKSKNLIELSIGSRWRRQTEQFEGVEYDTNFPGVPTSTFRWRGDGAFETD